MKIKKIVFINLQILMIVALFVFFILANKLNFSFTPYVFCILGGEFIVISLTIIDRLDEKRKNK